MNEKLRQRISVTPEDLERFTEMVLECKALKERLRLMEECLEANRELINRKIELQTLLDRLDEKAA